MRAVFVVLGLLAAPATTAAEPWPTIASQTAKLERHDGFIPYYWAARQGRLWLEVPEDGPQFLYAAGLAHGAGTLEVSLDRGQLGDLALVRFERAGPRVLLVRLQTAHRADTADRELARAVAESFPNSVLASLPIVAEEGGRLLIDATDFLLADSVVLPQLRQTKPGGWRQDVARSALRFERSGAFPLNTELEALLTFANDDAEAGLSGVLPDGRTLSLVVHHTFRKLPEAGFVVRAQDPRVGVFNLRALDHTAPLGGAFERFLTMRWRLRRRDPQAALSEPIAPLVYYLDRGIPEPERSAIREAALWWNHAFEAAGFKDALVIRDLPPGATFLDARYSGIEWIHRAERAWSIGEVSVDPRTGEILQAVARIDSHRRRTTARQWQNLQQPPRTCAALDAPDPSLLAHGAAQERALVLARLRYLSAHEVGHTLGFDHNWAATTFGWGSVMDYLAARVELKNGQFDLSDAFPTDVGSYDRLAVRWAYTDTEDPAALQAIVAQAYAQGIVYPLQSDPRWAEYDFGADPIEWLRTTQAVRAEILARFGPEQLEAGHPLAELQERFNLAYLYHRFGIQAAQQYVGGQYQTNALRGDGQTPTAWVPAVDQRRALELLVAALAPANLEIPERIVAALVPSVSLRGPSRERFESEAGAVFSPLTAARVLAGLIVRPLLAPEKAARLSLATGPRALTLAALIERLTSATWRAPAETSATRAALLRVSQRALLDALLELFVQRETTPEVRATVLASLRALRSTLALRHSADAIAEAHLRDCERVLTEFLEHPELRGQPTLRPTVPPGRPIGAALQE